MIWKMTGALSAIVVATALIFAFQNCSKDLPSNVTGGSSTDGSNGNPPGVSFAKDDAFDYNLVPNKSQMVSTMLSVKSYPGAAGPKAVAVTQSGLGFVAVPTSGTQDDANLIALQGCYVISGGQSCALLASGDKFSLSRNDLGSAGTYTYNMSAPTSVSAASLPFMSVAQATALANQYNGNGQAAKALAISLDGTAVFIANNMNDISGGPLPVANAAEATRIALERCEMMATIVPCTSFAEGAAIKFVPNAFNRSAIIDYTKTVPSGWMPGHTRAHGQQQIDQRWNTLPANPGYKGVIYLSADGRWGEDLDPNLATADNLAKNQCDSGATAQYPCFKYADSTLTPQIVFNGSNLKAFVSSQDLHCKAVPRLNCTQHKNFGCPAGTYYVTYTGAITTENCP